MNQNENFLEYLQDNGSSLDENEWYDSINKNEEEDDDLKAAVESQGESESSQSQQLLVQLDKIFQDELERRSKYAKVVFAVVLICGGLETVGVFSVFSNLVIFLNMDPLHWSSFEATSMYFVTLCIFCLAISFSAFVAELYIQPKIIILVSYVIYLIGIGFMSVVAYGQLQLSDGNVSYTQTLVLHICHNNLNSSNVTSFVHGLSENCRPLVDTSLIMFAVGSGVLMYHLPFFTFKQVCELGLTASYFFGCHSLIFVIAAGIGGMLVTFVQLNMNFFIGYLIGLSCLFVSFLLFVLILPAFDNVELRRTYISEIMIMFRYAASARAAQIQKQYYHAGQCPSRLSMAMEKYQGPCAERLVLEVRVFLRMLPLFSSLIVFWTLSYQASTSYIIQGLHMRLWDTNKISPNATDSDVTDTGFVFPPTWILCTCFITLILLIPIELYMIKPILLRLKLQRFNSPTVRITFGLIFLMISFVIAGFLEYVRIKDYKNCLKQDNSDHTTCIHKQKIGITIYSATQMNVIYQIPQFICMFWGQMLTLTGIFRFAYKESSNDTRGFIMSAFFFICALGTLLALLCLKLANKFHLFCGAQGMDYCNPNSGSMYVYFWILAGMQFLGILLFLFTMKTFKNFKKYDRAFPLF